MSTPLGGEELVEEEEVMKARDRREVERSKGESEIKWRKEKNDTNTI